jgi:hypothetical protein
MVVVRIVGWMVAWMVVRSVRVLGWMVIRAMEWMVAVVVAASAVTRGSLYSLRLARRARRDSLRRLCCFIAFGRSVDV